MTSIFVLFRIVGYGLLLLSLFDIFSAIIPPQLNEPGWHHAAPNRIEATRGANLNRRDFLSGVALAGLGAGCARKPLATVTPAVPSVSLVPVRAQVDRIGHRPQ